MPLRFPSETQLPPALVLSRLPLATAFCWMPLRLRDQESSHLTHDARGGGLPSSVDFDVTVLAPDNRHLPRCTSHPLTNAVFDVHAERIESLESFEFLCSRRFPRRG